ncbi:hypothetical protein [Peribacillus frigoritolerans]
MVKKNNKNTKEVEKLLLLNEKINQDNKIENQKIFVGGTLNKMKNK